MSKGSERKRNWAAKKRAQGWTWSEIRRGNWKTDIQLPSQTILQKNAPVSARNTSQHNATVDSTAIPSPPLPSCLPYQLQTKKTNQGELVEAHAQENSRIIRIKPAIDDSCVFHRITQPWPATHRSYPSWSATYLSPPSWPASHCPSPLWPATHIFSPSLPKVTAIQYPPAWPTTLLFSPVWPAMHRSSTSCHATNHTSPPWPTWRTATWRTMMARSIMLRAMRRFLN
jgi:hypothetical protein